MPIYDYHCDHCGHTFSAVQSYTDATLDTCPSCGKRPRKLMATPAIVFKGGGWYKTDSRPAQKDGGDQKSEGKTEGKPEAKPDTDTDKKDKKKDDKKDAPPAKADAPKAEAAAPAAKGGSTSS